MKTGGGLNPRTAGSSPLRPEDVQVTLEVEKMSCGSCEKWVTSALEVLEGVDNVVVDLPSSTVCVSGNADLGEMMAAVKSVGYGCWPQGEGRRGDPGPASPVSPEAKAFEGMEDGRDRLTTLVFKIEGMTCSACSGSIEKMVTKLPYVKGVKISLITETAHVVVDMATVTVDMAGTMLVDEIEDMGFGAEPAEKRKPGETAFRVEGMVCASCPVRIENVLLHMPGVTKVAVNYATQRAMLSFEPDAQGIRDLLEAINALGYAASPWRDAEGGGNYDRTVEVRMWRRLLIISLVFSFPIFLLMQVFGRIPGVKKDLMSNVLPDSAPGPLKLMDLLTGLLATPVQFIVGWRFYVGAWAALKHGSANMDTLIVLGTTTAYCYSAYVVAAVAAGADLGETHQFFEAAALLFTFVAGGKLMETSAKSRTSEAIRMLTKLQPDTAVLLREGPGGEIISEEEVDTALVQRGDLIKVAPGKEVPVDGEVVTGESSIDESMVTGESMPVTKNTGDAVVGGTINLMGLLHVRASGLKSEGMLSRIIALVEDAQTSKAPIQRYADMISGRFVPFVVAVAVATFVTWILLSTSGSIPDSWLEEKSPLYFSCVFTVAVLVIACPCALGLATPTAVMVGTGLAARYGVLIKGGEPLEKAHGIESVIFDKTGTLTMGRPEVVDTVLGPAGGDEAEFYRAVGTAEAGSEHPLGRCITSHARAAFDLGTDAQPSEFQAEGGRGIRCVVGGPSGGGGPRRRVVVGTETMLSGCGVHLSSKERDAKHAMEEQGRTVMLAAFAPIDPDSAPYQLAGMVAVADAVKPNAREAVTRIRAAGVDVWMVTGDNRRTAATIARAVGLPADRVLSEVLPGEKAAKVKQLQGVPEGEEDVPWSARKQVAMVGDGVNDAPALAQADLGIAMGAGSDIAVEAGDVVLVRDDPLAVHTALEVSRQTFICIKRNLFCSMLYNTLSIPIAAGVLFPVIRVQVPPEMAGLAMALSSTSVVASSLWLRRFVPTSERRPVPPAQGRA